VALPNINAIGSERMRRSFGALHERNYRLYLIGQMVSQIGTWMQRTAQAWLVLDLTGSPLALGTVTAVQFVPVLFFTLWGGVLADRVAKRDLMVVTQTLQMVQAFVLGFLVLTGVVQLWQVYVLALALGVTSAVDQPARRALASELVDREYVASAVALNSAMLNLARVVGPALGGLGIVLVGVAGCFLLNGVSFVAVIVALLMMRSSEFRLVLNTRRVGFAGQIIEGFVYATRTPDVAFTLILVGALGTFGYNFNVVLPLLARFALDSSALGFGGLNSALGIGSVAGALFAAGQGRSTVRAVTFAATVFSVVLGLLGLAPFYLAAIVLLLAQGFWSVSFSTTANTRVQLAAPPELRGRVMGIYNLVFVGTTPLGAGLTGAIADRWDIRAALVTNAACCLTGVALGLYYHRAHSARVQASGVAHARSDA
jgi:MFS family permease